MSTTANTGELKKSRLDRVLDAIERGGNALPHPFILLFLSSSAEPQNRPKTVRNPREGPGPFRVPTRPAQGLTGAHGLILVILCLVDTLPHHLLRWTACLYDGL